MTTRLTPEELKTLEELEAKATKAPWQYQTGCSYRRFGQLGADYRDGNVASAEKHHDGQLSIRIREEDGELIEAARNALPRLLAHIRTLESELAQSEASNYALSREYLAAIAANPMESKP